MATVAHSGLLTSATDATSYTTGLLATTADAVIVAFVYANAQTQATPTFASGSFTFSLVRRDGATDSLYVYVSDTLDDGVSKAFTFTTTANSTGCIILVASVSGLTRTGTSAIRQSATTAFNGSGTATTPTTTFGSSPDTNNPQIVGFGNNVNTANTTWTPTSFTRLASTNHNAPNTGGSYASVNSGLTGTSIAWATTTTTIGQMTAIEMDTSAPSAAVFPPVIMRSGGIIGA